MHSVDSFPRLPVSWKEFSDLLRASQPNPLVRKIEPAVQVQIGVKDEDAATTRPHARDFETHENAKQKQADEEDPIRNAIDQLRNGFTRSTAFQATGSNSDSIDVYA